MKKAKSGVLEQAQDNTNRKFIVPPPPADFVPVTIGDLIKQKILQQQVTQEEKEALVAENK